MPSPGRVLESLEVLMIPKDDDIDHANIGSNKATIDGAVAWALYEHNSFKGWQEHLEWFEMLGYLIAEDGDEDATEGRVATKCERVEHG